MGLSDNLAKALAQRSLLLQQLVTENTNAFRLFHGIAEGKPGLNIDIYKNHALIQSFHEPLLENDRIEIQDFLGNTSMQISSLDFRDRSASGSRIISSSLTTPQKFWFQECGIDMYFDSSHTGSDPLLFLDFRSTRRYLSSIAAGKSVLNLFSYTCGAGVAAACHQAIRVCNVDFADSALQYGKLNAEKNNVENVSEFIRSDFFTAARQMAGLEVTKRGAAKTTPYQKIPAQQFDIVLLDPPRFAKSAFGTVDLVHDYQSLFKPALLATKPGGILICTNNVAKVNIDDWEQSLTRCAEKTKAPLQKIERITPDSDFPSFDGQFPLKIAICHRA